MDILLVGLFASLFTIITWHRFSHGVFLLFLLLPTYLIRFSLGPLPSTLLELMIWIVCLVGIIRHARHIEESILILFRKYTLFAMGTLLFLLAATISVFTAVDLRAALGEWKAFYIEPFILFLVLFFSRERIIPKTDIVLPLILCGLATAVFAIYQHFTGWLVPWAFWENGNTYRVTAWYGFPNGLGLFVAPLVVFAAMQVWQHIFLRERGRVESRQWSTILLVVSSLLLIPLGTLAVYFAKSTGGLIGILAGLGLLLLLQKKTRLPAIALAVIGFLCLLSIPRLDMVQRELFFQDRSGQIRLSMWQETIELIKDRPILGAGLASYSERIIPYHTTVNGEGIEIYHHPHNLFLTFYVNLGLLGLLGFFLMAIGLFATVQPYTEQRYTIICGLSAILVIGLVDSPYIKNDLAVFFWVIPMLLTRQEE